MADPFEIPKFLKIPQAERLAAWEKHRIISRPISAVVSAGEDWRTERNRLYNEAARKDGASGQS